MHYLIFVDQALLYAGDYSPGDDTKPGATEPPVIVGVGCRPANHCCHIIAERRSARFQGLRIQMDNLQNCLLYCWYSAIARVPFFKMTAQNDKNLTAAPVALNGPFGHTD